MGLELVFIRCPPLAHRTVCLHETRPDRRRAGDSPLRARSSAGTCQSQTRREVRFRLKLHNALSGAPGAPNLATFLRTAAEVDAGTSRAALRGEWKQPPGSAGFRQRITRSLPSPMSRRSETLRCKHVAVFATVGPRIAAIVSTLVLMAARNKAATPTTAGARSAQALLGIESQVPCDSLRHNLACARPAALGSRACHDGLQRCTGWSDRRRHGQRCSSS